METETEEGGVGGKSPNIPVELCSYSQRGEAEAIKDNASENLSS